MQALLSICDDIIEHNLLWLKGFGNILVVDDLTQERDHAPQGGNLALAACFVLPGNKKKHTS